MSRLVVGVPEIPSEKKAQSGRCSHKFPQGWSRRGKSETATPSLEADTVSAVLSCAAL